MARQKSPDVSAQQPPSLEEGVIQAAARLANEPAAPGAGAQKYVGEIRKGRSSPWVRVEYPRLLCPFCHSPEIRTYSTKPRSPTLVVRWHICNGCRRSFQSQEAVSPKRQS